ncbi:MAG: hypothetical protein GY835_14415 [bacterium]|nr:hypothetical protein [bacterium]
MKRIKWKSNFSWGRTTLSLVGAVLLLALGYLLSTDSPFTRISAAPDKGFNWPYYLHVPPSAVAAAERGETVPLLVLPNNTGKVSDQFSDHEEAVLKSLEQIYESRLVGQLHCALLMPVFPRPESAWEVYTHALDRDALIVDNTALARFDIQLEGMIDDARRRLGSQGVNTHERVLLFGFSASGMFVNRFTALHPEQVLAVACGSPGGWPLVPLSEWEGRPLRYPIGVDDVAELTGGEFDEVAWSRVPQLLFMGDQDDNDSVPYNDGYSDEDKELIFELFGETPVSRWSLAEAIYDSLGASARFRLYPGVGHDPVPALGDVLEFFRATLDGTDR